MALDLILDLGHGVSKLSLAENAGTTQPQLVSAVAATYNTITVTFNQAMSFIGAKSVLIVGKYSVVAQVGGRPLNVLWITKTSDTVVVLHTEQMEAVTYDLVVSDVEDAYLQPIDTANDDDSFLGIAPTYPTISQVTSFIGTDVGLQMEDQPDWEPDVTPPYLDNEDPAPSAGGVAKDKIIAFDLIDDETAIDLTTVVITVEGATAYTGATDTFSAPYNGGGSGRTPGVGGPPYSHSFTIQKTADWISSKTIEVRVVAEDDLGNALDVTYDFDITDYAGPTISAQAPTGTGVLRTADVYFEVDDEAGGSGVDLTSLAVDVGGENAIIAGSFQPGWSGTITADGSGGFDVTIDKATDHGSFATVQVDVSVSDLDANPATDNWSFQVEDYLGPEVIPVNPTHGESEVSITSNISVRVQDEDEAVLSTMRVEVDQGGGFALAFDGSTPPYFQAGWDGPGSSITGPDNNRLIIIDKVGVFPTNTLITVKVIAEDPTGNDERI